MTDIEKEETLKGRSDAHGLREVAGAACPASLGSYTEALESAPASSEEKKEIEDQLARIAGKLDGVNSTA